MLQLSVEQKKRKEQRKKSRFNDSTKFIFLTISKHSI